MCVCCGPVAVAAVAAFMMRNKKKAHDKVQADLAAFRAKRDAGEWLVWLEEGSGWTPIHKIRIALQRAAAIQWRHGSLKAPVRLAMPVSG